MDLRIAIRPEDLKVAHAAAQGPASWKIRREPRPLVPAWANRLFVVAKGSRRGFFLVFGEAPLDSRDPE
jgi:hypothetical protein